MHELPINTRLQDGKLAVSKPLGQGGFGITYYGGDVQLRRYVAIKEFFPQGCTRQASAVQIGGVVSAAEFAAMKKKFLEEARVLAQFRHPGIVQVYSLFEENETAYIVMEFLQGKTLAQLVEERGALPEKEAVGYIEKAADALAEVHRAKLLHRDVKPENVMVCDDGRVVLIDFGLSKKVEEAIGLGTRQLSTTTRFGSDGYAPPEQYLKSGVLGTHTDVYALGATLYFLLTDKTPPSAIERSMGEALASPKSLMPTISENVNDAVMQALEMGAKERLVTAIDFANALTRPLKTSPSVPKTYASVTLTGVTKQGSAPIGAPNQTVSYEYYAVCPRCQEKNYIGRSVVKGEANLECCLCEHEFRVSMNDSTSGAISVRSAPFLVQASPSASNDHLEHGITKNEAVGRGLNRNVTCAHCRSINYLANKVYADDEIC